MGLGQTRLVAGRGHSTKLAESSNRTMKVPIGAPISSAMGPHFTFSMMIFFLFVG
jgi:hypothetical protein